MFQSQKPSQKSNRTMIYVKKDDPVQILTIEKLKGEIKRAKQEIDRQTRITNSILADDQKLEESNYELKFENRAFSENIQALRKDIELTYEEIISLQDQNDDLKREINDLNIENDRLKQELQDAEYENQSLNQKLRDTNQLVLDIIDEYKQEQQIFLEEKSQLKQQKESLQKKVEKHERTIKQLTRINRELHVDHEKNKQSLGSQLQNLEEKINNLTQQLPVQQTAARSIATFRSSVLFTSDIVRLQFPFFNQPSAILLNNAISSTMEVTNIEANRQLTSVIR